jgi:predicted nucleic acid-binding protein
MFLAGAIHLATALLIGDQLEVLVTYDKRLAAAANARRVAVVAPTATTGEHP